MFQSSAFELTRRVQHWHGANDWEDMEEVTPSHDSAEADAERSWSEGRIFRCNACDEQFRILGPETEPPSQRP